ncbi:glycerol-3-phosphate dehydrogenase [NAD(+)]-like isoform X2 [Asparagus officinalis]|uniref:glycerol-3-phosphate dehydrogenase [NAD(+)]-like isoform X2 n=1 Tax=Asparagus officinalis TaxID=4686 RepID=UPI00098DF143|nr:glycerol-3-phosphate dehydrogenase [NAD(+)]-like isoform X2 [Asparagus officinalis]
MAPQANNSSPKQEAHKEGAPRFRVTVAGSGNWGSVAAKLIASNTLQQSIFHDEVRMWVFEEVLTSGQKLTDTINRTNENVKYLPRIKLGKNVVADPNLENQTNPQHNCFSLGFFFIFRFQTSRAGVISEASFDTCMCYISAICCGLFALSMRVQIDV